VQYTKTLLDEIGIGGDRLDMFHIGASDAKLFAETVEEMHQRVLKLGPNPLRLLKDEISPLH
jgi:F420-non-reducing hydrogenase iron-sulfur subunit